MVEYEADHIEGSGKTRLQRRAISALPFKN